ncbi:nuclear transport factor 2 family protein [Croceicoccus sediminis]|uniref:nuclear transport factor 2 family protein n=1 Tax=Croceicoccus sediminis TaxID=2571150 RepID=UPI00196A251B|nr:nuclear transport factor 2 family protein [Croceicoccus sediminis]
MMRDTTAAGMEATIREYFDGCNEADFDKMVGCMEPEANHYFPAGAPQGTFFGAAGIANGWIAAVRNLGSIWTVDRVLADPAKREAVIEWTHFKTGQGIYLRGDEWYIFSERGLITQIRAYYAAPAVPDPIQSHMLGDYDYEALGYPMEPPVIQGRR